MYETVKPFIYLLFFTGMLWSENTAVYKIKSAKITYDIAGGGILTKDNNLTLKGIEKFYMKEYGATQLHRTKLIEKVDGLIEHVSMSEIMKKYENHTLYVVDFGKEVIFERKNSSYPYPFDLNTMERNGTDVIATYRCNVWRSSHTKVCLYQGIPLLIQKEYIGFTYIKRARFSLFDVNISDESFLLPEFAIEENTLVQNKTKTTNLHASKLFYEKILEGDDANRSRALLYEFTDDMIKKQKKYLPSSLDTMKRARECFFMASNQKSANLCMSELDSVTQHILEALVPDVSLWTKETKSRVMEYLEENIMKLQSQSACLRRTQNIDDLSRCLKK